MVKKIDKILTMIESKLIQILFLVMIIITLVQVFNRVLFNYPLPWADEFARYLFIWIVYLGSSYAVKENSHIGVTVLLDKLPRNIQRVFELIINILCLLFSIGLAYFTSQVIKLHITMGQISPSMRLPMHYAYLALLVGGVFMSIRFAIHIINILIPQNEITD